MTDTTDNKKIQNLLDGKYMLEAMGWRLRSFLSNDWNRHQSPTPWNNSKEVSPKIFINHANFKKENSKDQSILSKGIIRKRMVGVQDIETVIKWAGMFKTDKVPSQKYSRSNNLLSSNRVGSNVSSFIGKPWFKSSYKKVVKERSTLNILKKEESLENTRNSYGKGIQSFNNLPENLKKNLPVTWKPASRNINFNWVQAEQKPEAWTKYDYYSLLSRNPSPVSKLKTQNVKSLLNTERMKSISSPKIEELENKIKRIKDANLKYLQSKRTSLKHNNYVGGKQQALLYKNQLDFDKNWSIEIIKGKRKEFFENVNPEKFYRNNRNPVIEKPKQFDLPSNLKNRFESMDKYPLKKIKKLDDSLLENNPIINRISPRKTDKSDLFFYKNYNNQAAKEMSEPYSKTSSFIKRYEIAENMEKRLQKKIGNKQDNCYNLTKNDNLNSNMNVDIDLKNYNRINPDFHQIPKKASLKKSQLKDFQYIRDSLFQTQNKNKNKIIQERKTNNEWESKILNNQNYKQTQLHIKDDLMKFKHLVNAHTYQTKRYSMKNNKENSQHFHLDIGMGLDSHENTLRGHVLKLMEKKNSVDEGSFISSGSNIAKPQYTKYTTKRKEIQDINDAINKVKKISRKRVNNIIRDDVDEWGGTHRKPMKKDTSRRSFRSVPGKSLENEDDILIANKIQDPRNRCFEKENNKSKNGKYSTRNI